MLINVGSIILYTPINCVILANVMVSIPTSESPSCILVFVDYQTLWSSVLTNHPFVKKITV